MQSSLHNWQSQNTGNDGIRRCKEVSTCDLKCQWDCYKSVVRIRLEKAENHSASVTVNCNVCKSAKALYYL
jgi:hypothetical protein